VSGITLVTFNYSTTCISLLNTIIKAFEEVFPTFFDFQLENRALLLGPETAPASEVQIKANALKDFSESLLYSYNNSIIISEFLPFIYIQNINLKQLCYLGHNCFKLISNLALLRNLEVGGSYLG
jgi:hypothetical protein